MNQSEQLQRVWRLCEEETGRPSTSREASLWGYRKGLLALPEVDPIDVLADRMSRALREQYAVDEKGRRYRVNHAVTVTKGGVQYTFWARMGFAPRAHMRKAFALRREGIVSDCIQLKTDIDVYNDMNKNEELIQLVLNFTHDVEERMNWRGRGRAA